MTIDSVNRATLDIIERAQFILNLDPAHPGIDPKAPVTVKQLGIVTNRYLHGNGSAECSCNRWFDHGVQVLVFLFFCQLHIQKLLFIFAKLNLWLRKNKVSRF